MIEGLGGGRSAPGPHPLGNYANALDRHVSPTPYNHYDAYIVCRNDIYKCKPTNSYKCYISYTARLSTCVHYPSWVTGGLLDVSVCRIKPRS